jgi:hypothetical protein
VLLIMTATTWDGRWTSARASSDHGPAAASLSAHRAALWDHCRNSLGIARLLVREDRPSALVHTACHLAVEMACRAALTVAGEPGLVSDAQAVLPADLRLDEALASGAHLAAAERAVGWVADYLRSTVPERSWGF